MTSTAVRIRQYVAFAITIMFAAVTLLPSQANAEPPVKPQKQSAAAQVTGAVFAPQNDEKPAKATVKHAKANKPVKQCKNRIVRVLKNAGFRGENLREAWAITMRESGGRARVVSDTNDFGMFQFNAATWSDEPWWNSERLLTRKYNARMAYRLSEGGKTWLLWGLTGKGEANPKLYRGAGWSKSQVKDWIVKPYRKWYSKYPC